MVAADVPLLQEVDGPAVHTHGTYGDDHSQLLALVTGELDLQSDLMAHLGIEFVNILAGNGVEVLVPEIFPGNALFAAGVDFFHIPTGGVEAFQQGILYGAHKVHNVIPPVFHLSIFTYLDLADARQDWYTGLF